MPIFRFGQTYAAALFPDRSWHALHHYRLTGGVLLAGLFSTAVFLVLMPVLKNFNRELEAQVAARTREIREREQELRRTFEREAHIKQVLLAIRNVNQLIVKETDAQRLIDAACGQLTETLGYYQAAIALVAGPEQKVVRVAVAGKVPELESLRADMARGHLPPCMHTALESGETVAIDEPAQCRCLLAGEYGTRAALARRLVYDQVTYGVLLVAVPKKFLHNDEERDLFEELADDLGFALHKIAQGLEAEAREAFIQAVLDNLPIGVAVNTVGSEVAFDYMNALFARIYRTTPAALQEGNFWEAVYPDEAVREAIRRRVLEDCASGDPARMVWDDVPIRRPGEETAYVSARNIPVPGSNLMISTVMDITARKRAEEAQGHALEETRRLLEEADASRTELLKLMKEREELESQLLQSQKMEAIGRLAGGVAHDFNNMLQSILGCVELALGQIDSNHPIHADLLDIRRVAKRSAKLTHQLLAFARKQTIQPRILDLNDVVSGFLKMLRRLIGEDIRLVWQPGAGLWPVTADPAQVDQLLANLAVNARQAIQGTGTVTVATLNISSDAATLPQGCDCEPGEYVALSVSDTGCGMDEETLAQIFEPFFTTKTFGEGTGLGLAMVYGAMRQNNGCVHAESQPGKGAVFTLYFPRATEPSGPASEPAPAEAPPLPRGAETLLLVEDDIMVMKLCQRTLQKQGYKVLAFDAPEAALALVTPELPVDLLISDVIMPGMSGKELSRLIAGKYPGIKTLFISGYTEAVIVRQRILEKGAYFLQKPFTAEMLAVKVRAILDGKE